MQRNSRPHYIYELPSTVDGMVSEPMKNQLNRILKELLKVDPTHRMTANQFYSFVDDLVQTNLEMVDVLSGRSCKIPLESTVSLDTIQFEVTQSLGISSESQILLCDSPASKSKLTTQDNLLFFLRCATKNLGPIIIYVIDKNVILGNVTININFQSLSELNDILTKCDTSKRNVNGELKSYDMSLPGICVSVVKDMGKNQEMQMKALQSFAHFTTTAQDSYESAKSSFHSKFGVLEAKVSFLADCLHMDLEGLKNVDQYKQQVDSMTGLCNSLRTLLKEAHSPVGAVEEEYKRLSRGLSREFDRCLELDYSKGYQATLGLSLKIQYFSPPYSQRVREMVETVVSNYSDFLLKIQSRMQSSFSLMRGIHGLEQQLTRLSDNLSLVSTRRLLEVQTQWRQEVHALVVPSLPLSPAPQPHDEEGLTRQKRRANLQQQLEYKNRENAKLSDKCEKLKSQVKKAEARANSAEELLSKQGDILRDQDQIEVFYSCMKLIQTVCPPAASANTEPNLEREFSGLTLKDPVTTPVQKLQESLRDLSQLDINKLREQLERKLEARDRLLPNALLSVDNFKKGDFILFLPTKHQPGFYAIPQAFTTQHETVYLDRSSYKAFGLADSEPLRTWLIGRCTSDPILETVTPNCPYPAGKVKQNFYTLTAEATEYISTEPRRRTSSRNLNVPVKN